MNAPLPINLMLVEDERVIAFDLKNQLQSFGYKVGAVLASLMGTTGASMLLIRPLIRANDNRKHVVHVVVFFIFIVSNAGGSLTPLGDPPLFLGFLKGVDFSWT